MNTLDYSTNSKIKNFVNLIFSNGLISLISKPTRITKSSITCIDHIYTNSYINYDITAGIVKTDISDHFPIFIIDNNTKTTPFPEQITKQVRIMTGSNILAFKKKLSKTDWSLVLSTTTTQTWLIITS